VAGKVFINHRRDLNEQDAEILFNRLVIGRHVAETDLFIDRRGLDRSPDCSAHRRTGGAFTSTGSSRSLPPQIRREATLRACINERLKEANTQAFVEGGRQRPRSSRSRRWARRWKRPRQHSPTPNTDGEEARMEEYRRSAFVGSAAQVAERIEELAKRLNVREMAVVTWATDEPAHRKSYELLAKP
jgi:alkanesulfonate monooxygenase SsuD/methylene tetrahydromethanopterin reductase-like flavin-dependent oxidoreductase (luciferase family)